LPRFLTLPPVTLDDEEIRVMQPLPAPTSGDAGQVAPLMMIVVAVLLALLVGVVRLGADAAVGASAQSAADAAALAAALAGQTAAEEIAGMNGARVTTFRQRGDVVQVEVERSGRRAVATAERYLDGSP
jgi:Flp pilus assembly protein TadG